MNSPYGVARIMIRQGFMIAKPQPKKSSEFGQGLAYCIGLFLMHTERDGTMYEASEYLKQRRYPIWFNAASDHLYDMEIPESYPRAVQTRLAYFRDRCLELGHGPYQWGNHEITVVQYDWAIDEAKKLLRIIDRLNGVNVKKGSWE